MVIDGSLPLQPVNRALCTFAERKIPTRIRIDVEYQRGVPDRFMDDRANLMMILDFEDDSGTLEWECACLRCIGTCTTKLVEIDARGLVAYAELTDIRAYSYFASL